MHEAKGAATPVSTGIWLSFRCSMSYAAYENMESRGTTRTREHENKFAGMPYLMLCVAMIHAPEIPLSACFYGAAYAHAIAEPCQCSAPWALIIRTWNMRMPRRSRTHSSLRPTPPPFLAGPSQTPPTQRPRVPPWDVSAASWHACVGNCVRKPFPFNAHCAFPGLISKRTSAAWGGNQAL